MSPSKETVILLHGMGRSRISLGVLQICLKWAGYEVLNFPYSATFQTLDAITDSLFAYIQEYVKTPQYHFVAHSLGNIIVRNGFKKQYPPSPHRMVMMAPPNQPAYLAKMLKDNVLYKMLHGDSGQKLADEEFYQNLPIPPIEFGIIAGDKGYNIAFQETNDGIVTVESTRLEGEKDFLVVHHSHTFLMNCQDTIQEVIHFLRHGKFQK